MTDSQKIRYAFDSGILSVLEKLMLVLFYWMLGGITNTETTAFFAECGFTFAKPTTTGTEILTNGTTTYTIVSLITDYNTNSYPSDAVGSFAAKQMIKKAKLRGLITDAEAATLVALPW